MLLVSFVEVMSAVSPLVPADLVVSDLIGVVTVVVAVLAIDSSSTFIAPKANPGKSLCSRTLVS